MRENATKKQQQLLQFIADFIAEHKYAPSYREIMNALDYKSVSTVAVHVNGLIAKGFLVKKQKSARSIRVAERNTASAEPQTDNHLEWLADELAKREDGGAPAEQLDVLRKTLEILSYNNNHGEEASQPSARAVE